MSKAYFYDEPWRYLNPINFVPDILGWENEKDKQKRIQYEYDMYQYQKKISNVVGSRYDRDRFRVL